MHHLPPLQMMHPIPCILSCLRASTCHLYIHVPSLWFSSVRPAWQLRHILTIIPSISPLHNLTLSPISSLLLLNITVFAFLVLLTVHNNN